jgi:hypothetical protein
MNNKDLSKETLLGLGMVLVSGGVTMTLAKDWYGFVVILAGLAIIYVRGYMKTT